MAEKALDACQTWDEVLETIRSSERQVKLAGGGAAIDRQHQKGRLTARERIDRLLDPGVEFFELGLFSAFEMYREWGGAPAAGVIVGIGQVAGRQFMIVANDATVKAGSFFPMTVKKVLRAQRIAISNRLPLIYLVDSAGVFLPLQDEIFPDEDDFGRIFRNNAKISAEGIPQIAAIMGPCVAGGAYLPIMCDKVLMTQGSGLYIAGPSLVKAAIGQEIDSEELGGAELHSVASGSIDFREKDDPACLERIRQLAGRLGEWSLRRSLLSLVSARDRGLAVAAVERVGIADKLHARTSRLSGGEQQRVALARLLVQRPGIVLADEPVASLDPTRADDIVRLLTAIVDESGNTLIASLHSVELARRYFTRAIGLRDGRLQFDVAMDGLEDGTLRALYDLE